MREEDTDTLCLTEWTGLDSLERARQRDEATGAGQNNRNCL